MAKRSCTTGRNWEDRWVSLPVEIQDKIGFYMKHKIRTRTKRIRECRLACEEVELALHMVSAMRVAGAITRTSGKALNPPKGWRYGLNAQEKNNQYILRILTTIFGGAMRSYGLHGKAGADRICSYIGFLDWHFKTRFKWEKNNSGAAGRRWVLTDEWSTVDFYVSGRL